MTLTDLRREILEFLAVAEGFIGWVDLVSDGGWSWSTASTALFALERAGLVHATPDRALFAITAEGRALIGAPAAVNA